KLLNYLLIMLFTVSGNLYSEDSIDYSQRTAPRTGRSSIRNNPNEMTSNCHPYEGFTTGIDFGNRPGSVSDYYDLPELTKLNDSTINWPKYAVFIPSAVFLRKVMKFDYFKKDTDKKDESQAYFKFRLKPECLDTTQLDEKGEATIENSSVLIEDNDPLPNGNGRISITLKLSDDLYNKMKTDPKYLAPINKAIDSGVSIHRIFADNVRKCYAENRSDRGEIIVEHDVNMDTATNNFPILQPWKEGFKIFWNEFAASYNELVSASKTGFADKVPEEEFPWWYSLAVYAESSATKFTRSETSSLIEACQENNWGSITQDEMEESGFFNAVLKIRKETETKARKKAAKEEAQNIDNAGRQKNAAEAAIQVNEEQSRKSKALLNKIVTGPVSFQTIMDYIQSRRAAGNRSKAITAQANAYRMNPARNRTFQTTLDTYSAKTQISSGQGAYAQHMGVINSCIAGYFNAQTQASVQAVSGMLNRADTSDPVFRNALGRVNACIFALNSARQQQSEVYAGYSSSGPLPGLLSGSAATGSYRYGAALPGVSSYRSRNMNLN
ncbi:MAG: hypothetical protein JXA66_05190, partial [Oligoflexia bacterium]|nr:hypothetical protein [Oligoflexia bacterium]